MSSPDHGPATPAPHPPHAHDHAHPHHHPHGGAAGAGGRGQGQGEGLRGLRIALVLSAAFLVAEVVGGFAANSLALVADAGHLLTDVAALGLSLFVAWFSRQPETPEKTYGYLRWEILAALLNGATLLAVSVWIISEALLRVRHPQPIAGGLMLVVAVASVAVNLASAWVLHGGADASLNLPRHHLNHFGK
jgi:cobalt-zinc-cadmium efflux system protein